MQMRFLLLFLTFFCLSAAGFSQVGTVSGTVTSVSDGETLLGVSVMVKGTTNGTVTDLDGKYTISGIGTNAVLEFSYVGYEKLEIPVSGRSVVDVAMSAGNILTEVVVTSFGIAKDKKVLGYGSQSIKAAELMESSQPNVVNALQGRMAGVTINNSGGAPGSGASIIIRGINSLGGSDNQPLIVIDGIIISNATQSGNVLPSAGTNAINSGEQFMNSNRLGDVNMEDIENLNVLKGAAATALYGQRASNGAIIITTKKGKEGKTSVNYSYSLGLQDVVKAPEIQTTFYQGLSGIQRAAPATVFWQYGPPALPTDQTYNPFIDFFKTGVSNNHSLSFAGGSKNTIFQSSFSYLNKAIFYLVTEQLCLPNKNRHWSSPWQRLQTI
jgi:TonB-dependent SusC/RagA subfamily outer membrane receptor